MPRLADKVAVITGAGSGIGRATALLFAQEGAMVVAGVHRDRDIEPLEREAAGLRGSVHALKADVTIEKDVEQLIRAAVDRHGGLDVLFNNAGVEALGSVTETTDELWNHILDANLRGVFLCCRHAVPELLKRGKGSIVNNSSINGIRGNHRYVAYCASKAGVVGITRAMALDYAPLNIRVNCLCPATIEDTRIVQDNVAAAPDSEERRQYLLAKHPMGRTGRAMEVAYAALFLASDEASFITGVALPIDGGRHIR